MLCLKVPTDGAWAAAAMQDLDAVLVDHAHCELKAASNSLSLAARYPADVEIVHALTDLAREEIDHFQRVLSELAARGRQLGAPPIDDYAASLRRASNELPRASLGSPLVDRLLVGALIEARSCERFRLLVEALEQQTEARRDLHDLWVDLFASEAQHYRVFVDLAVRAAGGDREQTIARLDCLADVEARIVVGLASRREEVRVAIHG
ncbi:MAG TPA: tRNA isopentenyl-2-thiomethyl-A-37 hydroxylase MiaE [Polyangiaceae bacterium]|jgi:tRNA-(ms[2]io[6]A)-hydroxylase|nr:tRNA isopentenyl-2-thiomethyl-A-37 hydroxylase MiaE [Polyangiaceae bacterium]